MVHRCVCLLSSFSSLQLQAVVGNMQGRVRRPRPAARLGREFAIQEGKREWEPICTRFAAQSQSFDSVRTLVELQEAQEMRS